MDTAGQKMFDNIEKRYLVRMKEIEKNWPRIDDLEGRMNKVEDDLREFYKVLIEL